MVFGKAEADAAHLAVLEGPSVQIPQGLRRARNIIELDIARGPISPRIQAHPLVAGLHGEDTHQLVLRSLPGEIADVEDVAARIVVAEDARRDVCPAWDGPCAVSPLGVPDEFWGYGRKCVVCVS